jgi:hypothetical protein
MNLRTRLIVRSFNGWRCVETVRMDVAFGDQFDITDYLPLVV